MTLIPVLLLLLVAGVAADQCSQVDASFNACDVQRICSSCIVTSVRRLSISPFSSVGVTTQRVPLSLSLFQGCYFSLVDLRCELTTSSSSTTSNSSSSSSTAATTYCSDSDSLCASCAVSAAQPTCSGAGGCICPSVCSVVSSSSLESCSGSSSGSRILLGFVFMGAAVPVFMFAQLKLTETLALRGMVLASRERPGPPLRRRRPPRDSSLVPSLEAWRQHLEQHKDALQDVELVSCCYLKMDADQPELEADAESPAASSSGGSAEVVQVATTERQGGGGTSRPGQTAASAAASTVAASTTVYDQRAVMWIV